MKCPYLSVLFEDSVLELVPLVMLDESLLVVEVEFSEVVDVEDAV